MRPRWLSVAQSPPAAVPAGRGGHTHGQVRTAAGPAVVQLPARKRQELEEAGRSLPQSPRRSVIPDISKPREQISVILSHPVWDSSALPLDLAFALPPWHALSYCACSRR